jgi:hypothetical protein
MMKAYGVGQSFTMLMQQAISRVFGLDETRPPMKHRLTGVTGLEIHETLDFHQSITPKQTLERLGSLPRLIVVPLPSVIGRVNQVQGADTRTHISAG